jgi:hypothetical protein
MVDGRVVTDGPGLIEDSEVAAAKRWTTTIPPAGLSAAIEAAVQALHDLVPPSPSAAAYAAQRLVVRGSGLGDHGSSDMVVLARAPDLDVAAFARALASAFFRDAGAHAVFDCRLAENGSDGLFGAPPGYRGCLEGGRITNRLRLRPESVVVLDNIEHADRGTLAHIRSFARDGKGGMLVARGAQVITLEPKDAVFVLATTRAFATVGALLAAGHGGAFEELLASLQRARPDLDWDTCREAFIHGRLCVWGDLTPAGA